MFILINEKTACKAFLINSIKFINITTNIEYRIFMLNQFVTSVLTTAVANEKAAKEEVRLYPWQPFSCFIQTLYPDYLFFFRKEASFFRNQHYHDETCFNQNYQHQHPYPRFGTHHCFCLPYRNGDAMHHAVYGIGNDRCPGWPAAPFANKNASSELVILTISKKAPPL